MVKTPATIAFLKTSSKINSLNFHRKYPGEFKSRQWTKTLTEDEKRRLNLTQHEFKHNNIKH